MRIDINADRLAAERGAHEAGAAGAQRGSGSGVDSRIDSDAIRFDIAAANHRAAESDILDVQAAGEMVERLRAQLVRDSATALAAQANLAPKSVLSLLDD